MRSSTAAPANFPGWKSAPLQAGTPQAGLPDRIAPTRVAKEDQSAVDAGPRSFRV